MNTPPSPHRRRWLRRGIIGAPVGVALAGAAAWAVYNALAGITGGGTTNSMTASWTSVSSASGVTTTAPTISSGSLALPTSSLKFWPGDAYTFTAKVQTTGSNGTVTGLSMPGLGTGYSAQIVKGCGVSVGQFTTESQDVSVKITAGANATGSWTLGNGAAVLLTPTTATAGTVDATATCPAVQGGQ